MPNTKNIHHLIQSLALSVSREQFALLGRKHTFVQSPKECREHTKSYKVIIINILVSSHPARRSPVEFSYTLSLKAQYFLIGCQ